MTARMSNLSRSRGRLPPSETPSHHLFIPPAIPHIRRTRQIDLTSSLTLESQKQQQQQQQQLQSQERTSVRQRSSSTSAVRRSDVLIRGPFLPLWPKFNPYDPNPNPNNTNPNNTNPNNPNPNHNNTNPQNNNNNNNNNKNGNGKSNGDSGKNSNSSDNKNKPVMDLAMFTQIAEITDCLYLSAAAGVKHDRVRHLRITHIINCTLDIPNFKAPDVECINIQVDDSSRAHLGIYFDRCADMIRQANLKGGKVLVHCVAGISRSASLCIAYLMKYERMNLLHAYHYVKRKRPVIHPNVGFWRQLIDYEKRVFGRASVKMVNSNVGMVPDVYIEEANDLLRLQRHSRYR